MAEGVVEWMMREGNEFVYSWIFIMKERKDIYIYIEIGVNLNCWNEVR